MPRLRRLNDEGIRRFERFLDSQSTDEPQAFDIEVLNDPKWSEVAGDAPDVDASCDFRSRFEAAAAVADIMERSSVPSVEFDRGLWCWLSWLWFESLCPPDRSGRRTTGELARWVLDLDYKRYYRHLLAGPWWIHRAHADDPKRAMSLLCTPVTKPGELVGQIAASQELVSNRGLVEMVTLLYYDQETRKLRRGHGGKGAGSARRLVDVVKQLDMIWDLYSTGASEFLELLPREFDRFRQQPG